MKQLAIAAALVMAVVIATVTALPPSRQTLPIGPADGTIPGIIHVHTVRSDGRGTPDEVAQAAARAGLKFVVFTDHGDATRQPDPPTYRSGVLCLDGVEISTTGGHYAAVGLGAAPYPLGGAPADVVDDVHRLGGFGIAAHPGLAKGRVGVARLGRAVRRRRDHQPGYRVAPAARGARLAVAPASRPGVPRLPGASFGNHRESARARPGARSVGGGGGAPACRHDGGRGRTRQARTPWRGARRQPFLAAVSGLRGHAGHAIRARTPGPSALGRCRCRRRCIAPCVSGRAPLHGRRRHCHSALARGDSDQRERIGPRRRRARGRRFRHVSRAHERPCRIRREPLERHGARGHAAGRARAVHRGPRDAGRLLDRHS